MDSTGHVLKIFEQLSSIPRGSGREEQVTRWLQGLAGERGYPSLVDAAGNLVIQVPGTAGRENDPIIILQGHMDMVCEKTPDSPHDFLKDPIRNIMDGDWLHADRTTLGADNGIAIALALALVADPAVSHPPLELLFTVQEEVGLGGVNELKPDFLKGRTLLNLDSEEEGTFIVGCAGGQTTHIYLPVTFEKPVRSAAFQIKVSGLRGGHSGVDINKHYASANRLIARALDHLYSITPLNIMSLNGGSANNAIAREAWAGFTCDAVQAVVIRQAVHSLEEVFNREYAGIESRINLELAAIEPGPGLGEKDSGRLIQLIMALPHGIAEMSAAVSGFVETSSNLGRIELSPSRLEIVTNQRSSVMTNLEDLTRRITSIAMLAGADVSSNQPYPGWKPDMDSKLLKQSMEAYEGLFGRQPQTSMIHGGLECGTIGSIYPGMEMISLGATIENPHSPTERMNIPSIERVWKYLVEFLRIYR